jgi:hypothetical protein
MRREMAEFNKKTTAVSKHTPGPWTMSCPMGTGHLEGREPWFWVSADRTLHLQVAACPDGYVAGENEANARLIADAPRLYDENKRLREVNAELLEALTDLLGWQTLAPDDVVAAARAAIRARGSK